MARYRRTRVAVLAVIGAVAMGVPVVTSATADAAAPPTPSGSADPALGNGLGRLLTPAGINPNARSRSVIDQSRLTIRDAQGRVLIDLTPQAGADRASYQKQVAGLGVVITATDATVGTVEGYAPLSAVRSLQALPDTGTIKQVLKPYVDTGSVTSQGVVFQRVDKVLAKGIDGRGITVGVLSDSYDTATLTRNGDPLTDHAAQDIASGDLPGPGNAQYPQPVKVLQDFADPSAFDEGRAMLQIIHDVAPAARLCFATADAGEVQFANNIRALADPTGPCKADIVVDDVGYFDEPMFSDGVVAKAVDDVAAEGVSYFSAAGNEGDPAAWAADVNLVSAAQGVPETNLDFSDVPAQLYSGGLQDFDPGPGTDIAQSLTLGADGGDLDLQWNDPIDYDGATYGKPYFTASGALAKPGDVKTYTFTPKPAQLGTLADFRVDGVPSGTTDLVLTVTKPDGTVIGPVDTGTSPEFVDTRLDQPGKYTIAVAGFEDSTGPFTVVVRPILAPSKVTTDFNLLLFDAAGDYLGALDDDNTLGGLPEEIAALSGIDALQIVIARAGTGPTPVTKLRYVIFGDIYQDEYENPLAPATYGHPVAAGAEGVAAWDPFRPYLPEYYTSPGGDLPIYFDVNGDPYPSVQHRLKPDVAATDGGNTTFFVRDTTLDPDTLPNFFGTSAAAPHAAAIAALLLERAGGRRSLSPDQVRARLQSTAFPHDLDPNHAQGSARGLTISADGAQNSERLDTVPGAMTDTHFFTVRNDGNATVRSITLYGESASPTASGTTHPPLSDGIVFDPRPFTGAAPFSDQGFPFTVGSASGVAPNSISAGYSRPYGSTGTFRHLTITFARGLRPGAQFQFGVDRDLAQSGSAAATSEGNGADELGGAVFLPQGFAIPLGLAFTAVRTDRRLVAGLLQNRLGRGFSPVDGYGVINAEAAVLGSGG